MTEPCGCKGKPDVVGEDHPIMRLCRVRCTACGITTASYNTREQAIAAWNRAMGKDLRDAVDVAIYDLSTCIGERVQELVAHRLEAARKGAK